MNLVAAARTEGMLQAVSAISKNAAATAATRLGTVFVIRQNLLRCACVSLSILRKKSSENEWFISRSFLGISANSVETTSRSAVLSLFSAIIVLPFRIAAHEEAFSHAPAFALRLTPCSSAT